MKGPWPAALLTDPGLRGWSPLRAGDPPELLERGSTYLPYEREMRGRWESWLRELRHTSVGQRVPQDLVAVLREATPPLGLFRAVGRRPAYRPYPVPARPVEGPWVVLEDPRERPQEGACYRLRRPLRRAVVWRNEEGGLSTEDVLLVSDVERLPESEFFPGPQLSYREAGEALGAFSEWAGLSSTVAPLLLMPFVGAPPWHGRAPGVDVVMGSWGVPSGTVTPASGPLRALLPPWEVRFLSRGKGRGRRAAGKAPSSAPYAVSIEPLGARAWQRVEAKGPGFESSFLLYGSSDGGELLRLLFDAHVPLFDPLDRWQELAVASSDPEAAGAWADYLIRAHFRDPRYPDEEELHRGLDRSLATVRASLSELPESLGLPKSEYEGVLTRSVPLRDHLVQAALARAKVLGREAMGPEDLLAIAARFVETLSDPSLGSSKATRQLLTQGGRVRSRREQSRYFVLRAVLMERPDLGVEELWDRLRRKGLWERKDALESYLHHLSAGGVLASLRPGIFRWEGL